MRQLSQRRPIARGRLSGRKVAVVVLIGLHLVTFDLVEFGESYASIQFRGIILFWYCVWDWEVWDPGTVVHGSG